MQTVKQIGAWSGWCSPCQTERPLSLTETGPRGVRAFLAGRGADDRTLLLTCRVCGRGQDVPRDAAQDVTSVVLHQPDPRVVRLPEVGPSAVVVLDVPAPRTLAQPATAPVDEASDERSLALLLEGWDPTAVAVRPA